ncbi:hypothetical protein [Aeoliella mucimassa]|uniref:Outer membrane protein beta-barrel domain-containing protein n=1 Tax=Aeoliella mucimassa TaxID=2527972 RepID=A0A518AGX5_9BACT|nr:hypothetical protein [Aeoliella mucimassa]QDU53954.1 hypothetical protein Pan181_01330 [Aeoliella mucimassa]
MRVVLLLMVLVTCAAAGDSIASNPAYDSLDIAPAANPSSFAPPAASDEPQMVYIPPGSMTPGSYDPAVVYQETAIGPQLTPSLVACSTNYRAHWFGGTDIGITTMSFTSSAFALDEDRTSVSVRPYIGFENSEGLGFRVQAWMTGMEPQAIAGGSGAPMDLETGAAIIDFEIYKRLQVDTLELMLGVGGRGAGLGFTFADDSEDTIGGGGLTAFAEGYHPLRTTYCSEWGVFGGGRISMLAGTAELDNSVNYSRADGTLSISEANLGIRYRRHLAASDFVFQFQVEKQLWDTNFFDQVAYTTTGMRFGLEW